MSRALPGTPVAPGRGAFSEEAPEYVVLKLALASFRPSPRKLPAGFVLLPPGQPPQLREQERRLLEASFRHWRAPFRGELRGFRPDSALFVATSGRLAGGLYLTAGNEVDDDPAWGQLHYFFVASEWRGLGLHSLLVQEALDRARAWGLAGVYVNTDRHGLPELYERWGARRCKVVGKPHRPSPWQRIAGWRRRRCGPR